MMTWRDCGQTAAGVETVVQASPLLGCHRRFLTTMAASIDQATPEQLGELVALLVEPVRRITQAPERSLQLPLRLPRGCIAGWADEELPSSHQREPVPGTAIPDRAPRLAASVIG
jgi:hypothetical protein